MTLALTRAAAWDQRHAAQDLLAAHRVERRLVYAIHGDDGADRAHELDALIVGLEAEVVALGISITDWAGVCA